MARPTARSEKIEEYFIIRNITVYYAPRALYEFEGGKGNGEGIISTLIKLAAIILIIAIIISVIIIIINNCTTFKIDLKKA